MVIFIFITFVFNYQENLLLSVCEFALWPRQHMWRTFIRSRVKKAEMYAVLNQCDSRILNMSKKSMLTYYQPLGGFFPFFLILFNCLL